MSLRVKLLLILGFTIPAIVLAVFWILSSVVSSSFGELETRDAQLHTALATDSLDDELARIDSLAGDWATWDGLARFAAHPTQEFIDANLRDATMSADHLSALALLNTSGKLVAAVEIDSETGASRPVSGALRQLLYADTSLASPGGTEGRVRGTVLVADTPYLVVSCPVVGSNPTAPPRGVLVMMRRLDASAIAELSTHCGLPLTLCRPDDPAAPADVRALNPGALSAHTPLVRIISATQMCGYLPIADIHGRTVLVLRAPIDRNYLLRMHDGLSRVMRLMMLIGLGYGIAALWLLERRVFGPLARLDGEVARIGDLGDLSARVTTGRGRDELTRVAGRVNSTLDALQCAQSERDESAGRYRAVVEGARDGIAFVDAETECLLEANQALHTMLGHAPGGLLNRTASELWPDAVLHMQLLLAHSGGGKRYTTLERVCPCADGTPVPLEISFSVTSHAGREAICAIVRDVSERRRAEDEKAKLEQELRRSQRMTALGQLTAGLAHNFNNLLTIIMGNAQICRAIVAEEPAASRLDAIEVAATRGAELVKQFALFSRDTSAHVAPFALDDVVHEVASACRSTFDKSIAVDTDHVDAAATVCGDVSQLHDVILNLCINARDALDNGGQPAAGARIELSTAVVEARPPGLPGGPDKAGMYAQVTVRDNGMGMPPEVVDRVYEPFFTTKGIGKGTGLGLSTAYGVIAQHDGWMECRSKLGEGTTFRVYLPVAGEPIAVEKPVVEATPRGSDETILLVDDESDLRDLGSTFLRDHGYRVLTAEDGTEGMSVFETHCDSIDLILLDLSMPGMPGTEVLHRVLSMSPETRVLVCTGYLADGDLPSGAKGWLAKPYATHQLLKAVRDVLDA